MVRAVIVCFAVTHVFSSVNLCTSQEWAILHLHLPARLAVYLYDCRLGAVGMGRPWAIVSFLAWARAHPAAAACARSPTCAAHRKEQWRN